MPIDEDDGIPSMFAAVLVMTILLSPILTCPPTPSKTNILKILSPDFVKLTSTFAPSFRGIRP
ncbi:MAG: hypothetical protein ACD_51C00324G0001, partial [uncultured bacterium]